MPLPHEIETVVRTAVREYVQSLEFQQNDWTVLYTGIPSIGTPIHVQVFLEKGKGVCVHHISTMSWYKSVCSFYLIVEMENEGQYDEYWYMDTVSEIVL